MWLRLPIANDSALTYLITPNFKLASIEKEQS